MEFLKDKISRRQFLKGAVATAAVAAEIRFVRGVDLRRLIGSFFANQ